MGFRSRPQPQCEKAMTPGKRQIHLKPPFSMLAFPHRSRPRRAIFDSRICEKLLRGYGKDRQFRDSAPRSLITSSTAKRAGRTGFDAMIAYLVKNTQCRILLVEKTDRLYRNFRDWVTIDEIKGLEVHFVKRKTRRCRQRRVALRLRSSSTAHQGADGEEFYRQSLRGNP